MEKSCKDVPIDDIKSRGFSLVEAILSLALFAIFVMAFAGAVVYGQESAVLSGQRNRAALLAEEGVEAVRNIRDENFANLTDGLHGLAIQNNQWVLTGAPDVTDIFSREIIIQSVNADEKQVSVKIQWAPNLQRTSTVAVITFFTNFRSSTTP